MAAFELERLSNYDDQSLINELKRVAELVSSDKLSRSDFNRLSKVHASTLHNRFGNWRKALAAAGLEDRFDDRTDMWSRDEIIGQLQAIARSTGKAYVTLNELGTQIGITQRPIRRIFGSYRAALEAAGLYQSLGGVRYTDEECFENLLTVWTALGRQPFYSDLSKPPSKVGPKAYVGRWGSWRKALQAFVERTNQDTSHEEPAEQTPEIKTYVHASPKRTSRNSPLGLRYKIFSRDCFRCVLCGQSPATSTPPIKLHVDHAIPWSRGGETVEENLRTLCEPCNLVKGARLE